MDVPKPLWVILALFVALTLAFSINTPFRKPGLIVHQGPVHPAPDIGAPDELQHANYIAYLRSGKGFPVLDPSQPDFGENYQSHQPPLYYLVATGWCAITGSDPTNSDDSVKIRFLNTLIGLGTILGTFYLARWGLGRDDVGLTAAAFVALIPMSLAIHAAVSNDPLLYCLMTWSLALLVLSLQKGWNFKRTLILAIFTGLAILTKTTALALLPTIVVALGVTYVKKHEKLSLTIPAIALIVPVLIALPWLLRNQSLYGDPFALKAFNEAFTGNPHAEMYIAELGAPAYWLNFVLWWTSRSFIGVFGYMEVFLLEFLQPNGMAKSGSVYVAIMVLVFGPMILGALTGKLTRQYGEAVEDESDEEESTPPPSPALYHWVATTLIVVVVALFVKFNTVYFQGQARYVYPAIAPLAILFALGLSNLLLLNFRQKTGRLVGAPLMKAWIAAAVFFLVLDGLSLQTIILEFPRRLAS